VNKEFELGNIANQKKGISERKKLPDNIILVKLPYDGPGRSKVLKETNEVVNRRKDCNVILDFYKAEIISSCDISNLLILQNLLKKTGRHLVLCNVAKMTKYIFVTVGVKGLFCYADDMVLALEMLSSVDSLASNGSN
jgi:anti-anti-sigma regulatory factor